mmetsp:Transcript_104793/g.306005  ORF Transcript_104793/g.306005 Transcript_104793/m.306005 type:complete len:250 (-) Transcript_104793:1429-2178(-)
MAMSVRPGKPAWLRQRCPHDPDPAPAPRSAGSIVDQVLEAGRRQLDKAKVPDIREADVRPARPHLRAVRAPPAEWPLSLVAGAARHLSLKARHEATAHDLGVDAPVRQRPLWAEVHACRDLMPRSIRSRGRLRVHVAAHESSHVEEAVDAGCGVCEDRGPWVRAPRVQRAMRALGGRVPGDLSYFVEEWPVEGRPKSVLAEKVRHVLDLHCSRDDLQDPEGVVLHCCTNLEEIVVHDHPLGSRGAGVSF